MTLMATASWMLRNKPCVTWTRKDSDILPTTRSTPSFKNSFTCKSSSSMAKRTHYQLRRSSHSSRCRQRWCSLCSCKPCQGHFYQQQLSSLSRKAAKWWRPTITPMSLASAPLWILQAHSSLPMEPALLPKNKLPLAKQTLKPCFLIVRVAALLRLLDPGRAFLDLMCEHSGLPRRNLFGNCHWQ